MKDQDILKSKLIYNENSGIFTHKTQSGRARVGDPAGAVNCGYIQIRFKGKLHRAHRLAWLYVYGYYPKHQLDHINHDRSDNRICNLREVTNSENARNRSLSSKNKSGILGVFRDEKNNKWKAQIKIDGKTFNLGRYSCFFDACCARMSANNKNNFHPLHGR